MQTPSEGYGHFFKNHVGDVELNALVMLQDIISSPIPHNTLAKDRKENLEDPGAVASAELRAAWFAGFMMIARSFGLGIFRLPGKDNDSFNRGLGQLANFICGEQSGQGDHPAAQMILKQVYNNLETIETFTSRHTCLKDTEASSLTLQAVAEIVKATTSNTDLIDQLKDVHPLESPEVQIQLMFRGLAEVIRNTSGNADLADKLSDFSF
ncbi:hypothetical protein HNP46_005794 [Pseudomonas nitritireducens]|uniref:Uncharacterized protein n=1 Tax=Pseudomonas nitroreducens TaxID=46680 RepID=A0A7W7P537_PSENT|nr:hypothetical protein [Pseudomonas nitritireducens]MBB4866887.1 hypothetical protein [Pseudomonas nitritireducens]